MIFRMVYKSGQIFLLFCHNSRVWRTDRQKDGRTEFSSQYRVCITCSAVKYYATLCKEAGMAVSSIIISVSNKAAVVVPVTIKNNS